MANKKTTEELIKEAVAVWHNEGMDSTDSDSPLYNLHDDPISKLIIGAVNHQSNSIFDDIATFRDDLAEECLDLASPVYLFSPIPSIGMLQTAKGHSIGLNNNEKTKLDGNMSFVITKDVGTKRLTFPFMPLLSIVVMDLSVRSVTKVSRNRWRMEIEDMEGVKDLQGLSFFLPNIEHVTASNYIHRRADEYDDKIKLYVDDYQLPVCNISDFDKLPFVQQFGRGMVYSKNTLQCNVLQNIQDTFCCHVNNYCIIDRINEDIDIPRRDGCILIDIELPLVDDDIDIQPKDVLLNCVPIINVDQHTINLTQYNPIQPVEVDNGFFLTNLAVDDSCNGDTVALRRVATSRMSPELWIERMGKLLDYYNSQHIVMEHLLDEKMTKSLPQFIALLKQSIPNQKKQQDEGLYLVLKNKMLSSVSVPWLSTSGEMANDFGIDSKLQCTSAELDSDRTKLVTKTVGGRNPMTDATKRQRAVQYYQISRDRIISKSDIVAFCRYKLSNMFSVASSNIEEIRIYNIVRNSLEGFYERILVVDIKVCKGCVDPIYVSYALERMIRYRTSSLTPVRVVIND